MLFTSYGLKKTSIDDIVNACNIGKGTFYRFFQSKEELYFTILEKEEEFRTKLIEEMLLTDNKPKEAFKTFLKNVFEYISDNQFLSRVIDGEDVDILFRKLPKERLENHFKKDEEIVTLIIAKWKNLDVLKEENPVILTGILQSLFYLFTFKDKLGKNFPLIIDRLIDFIVEGIFNKNDPFK